MTWSLPYELPRGGVDVESVLEERNGPWPVRWTDRRFTRPLLDGGWIDCDRDARRAVIGTPHALTAEEFTHPYAGAVAAPFALWDGLEAMHAGAFCVGGRAVVVLGHRTAGKSTLLAHAAVRGYPVLTDDLAILSEEGGDVWVARGPRCVDLRPAAAAWLAEQATVDSREVTIDVSQRDGRHRLLLADAPRAAPLAGFVVLGVGEQVEVRPVSASRALSTLTAHRSLRSVQPDPRSWLRTATAPVIELLRPDDLDSVPMMLEAIRSEVASGRLASSPSHRQLAP